jgi:hypothetical protein
VVIAICSVKVNLVDTVCAAYDQIKMRPVQRTECWRRKDSFLMALSLILNTTPDFGCCGNDGQDRRSYLHIQKFPQRCNIHALFTDARSPYTLCRLP